MTLAPDCTAQYRNSLLTSSTLQTQRFLLPMEYILLGPAASAKSLFMLEIEKLLRSKVYFEEGASTTKA
jgi:hypothetical protein